MRKEEGLTLIELVVSVAVLSLVILPYFGVFIGAVRLDERSKNDLTANYLAQKLTEEGKRHPFDHAGWKRTDTAGAVLFEKDALDDPFDGYSARILYEPLPLSVVPHGLADRIPVGEHGYAAVFNLTWDRNSKTLSYVFGDTPLHTVNATDTSSDMEINLSNHEGADSYLIEVKTDRTVSLAFYPFSLDPSIDSIRIKVLLDQESTIDQSGRTVTVSNSTRDQAGSGRAIALKVDLVGFELNDHVEILPLNAVDDIAFNSLGEGGDLWEAADSQQYRLTVRISCYDPISRRHRVLRTFQTTTNRRE